jgi:hypothetical protein
MSPTINLPEQLHARLERMGGSLFTVAEVVERLVSEFERRDTVKHLQSSDPVVGESQNVESKNMYRMASRSPRERGITVEFGERRVVASTVADLYEQILRLLVDSGQIMRLRPFLPYPTSSKRYLIADKPVHPNGHDFVLPIQYSGLHMETHKDYKNAVSQLSRFLAKGQIRFRVLG